MKHDWNTHLALFMVQLFFSSLYITGKLVMGTLEPMALAGLRIGGAAVCLLGLRALMRLPLPREKGIGWKLLLLALLGVTLNQVLFLKGLALSSAMNAAVLMTAIPVMTSLVSVILGQERAGMFKLLGIGLSLVGALLIIGVDGLDFSSRYLVGNLLMFLNTVAYSFYLVLARPVLARYPTLSVVSVVFGLGALLTLPLCMTAWVRTDWSAVSWVTGMLIASIVLFPTVGAYLLNAWALKRSSPSLVVVYIYTQPVMTSILSALFLKEELTGRVAVAAGLIGAGVWLVSREAAQRARESSSHT